VIQAGGSTSLKHPSYLVHCIIQLMYHFGIFALSCMEDNHSTYITNWHFGVCEEDGYYHNSNRAVTDTDNLVCTFTIKHNWDLYFSAILWEFLTDILGPIGCPKVTVRNYRYMLRSILEEGRSYLLRGGSLKSYRNNLLAEKPSCPVCCTVFIHCSSRFPPQVVIIFRELQTSSTIQNMLQVLVCKW